jgi:two-component system OmpR family response regulator
VLVVDDNAEAAEALATYLSYEGVETRTAIGCGEALRCVRDWVPDVVVLDIMMPERDGFETAQALRTYLPAKQGLRGTTSTVTAAKARRRSHCSR